MQIKMTLLSNVTGQSNWVNSVFCLKSCEECDSQLAREWVLGVGMEVGGDQVSWGGKKYLRALQVVCVLVAAVGATVVIWIVFCPFGTLW